MSALEAAQRGALERVITAGRRTFERDLASTAEGRFGIHADGTLELGDRLHLDDAGLADRRELVDVITHLRSEGLDGRGAVSRLVRDAAFTHLNRLVAIRIAEAVGLLPPALAQGRASQGYRDYLEIAPLLQGDDTAGYWTYLTLCADELAADTPTLFDPRNPLLAIVPSPTALDEVVGRLGDVAIAEIWTADDTLGWVYQLFITDDDRRAARYTASGKPKAPENEIDLAVRNQFFTPRYVVDFLVHNSLGRRLLEANPSSPLIDDLPLLLDSPRARGEPLDLHDAAVLDPACGSGHFLLGAYDVLERAWAHAGVHPSDAAPHILRSLWGIDIDPRCCQIAAAAVMLRARRHFRGGALPTANIICARALPATATGMDTLLGGLPSRRRQLIERMTETLADAPVLGPLLKIEQRFSEELQYEVFGLAATGTLAETLDTDALDTARDEVIAALHAIADAAESTPAERLVAAEAEDAVRFVDAMARRYDVVLMNPPFGEPVPSTKEYLKAAYPWIPTRDYNLLAAFVGRGLELCKPTGYLGAITSRAGMFLKTFESWRTDVMLGHHLVALTDLGYGVMAQALVEAAAYVIGGTKAQPDHEATFVRLLKDTDRPRALDAAISAHRAGADDHRVFTLRLDDLDAVPGSPIAYWMSPSIRRLFTDYPPIEGDAADVRVGLQTGDDFQFVRALWEVDPGRIARSRDETFQHKRWVPFAKGGEYSPFWADIHLVVDYERDGERLRAFDGSVIRNPHYYFRPGLTWPRRTNSGFGIRVLPGGSVFADKGSVVSPQPHIDVPLLLGWLRTRVVQSLLDAQVAAGEEVSSGGASRSYEVGLVQKIAWPGSDLSSIGAQLTGVVAEIMNRSADADALDETTRRFSLVAGFDPLVRTSAAYERYLEILEQTALVEATIHDALHLDEEGLTYLDDEVGPHPWTYPDRPLEDEAKFERLFVAPIDAVIDEIIEEKGGARAIANLTYFADRRLEVLCHAFERHPRVIAQTREALGLLPPEEPRRSADDLFSYLVGLAFGRWDARIDRDQSRAPSAPDLMDPPPLCSPAMLVGDDALPADVAPSGYPLRLPAPRLLVDEAGHDWDVEAVLQRAASVLLDDPDSVIEELLATFGRKSLRDVLRRDFFNNHLGRYTKSRRKAPIYWPLTVPSRQWGVWVYASFLSRETLFAIEREANRRLGAADAQIRQLERERERESGRTPQQLAKALDAERALAEELRVFRAEAERVAALGWEPDLDDGIVLCAAPLATLFPAWKDAGAHRDQLRAGEYAWATVARFAEKL